ncbi:MAG: argininosuccinate lyase [Aggregatilineales bacterium]
MTLWGGRFSEPAADDLRRLNDSIRFDRRLYAEDIAGSKAYARALAQSGVIAQDEADTIIKGLQRVLEEFEAGDFAYSPNDEDIHTAVERRLIELVGPVGGKLHTGRSRNDQVATDTRLWLLNRLPELDRLIEGVQLALLHRADEHTCTLMPGFTHLQPAQPITVGHWLMSFFWMFARDRERLEGVRRRTAVLPLGSGALAGIPFEIDRNALASELGFFSYSQNSIDAVSDRDFVAETLFTLSLANVHLSRLAEDIIIYSNPLFGFLSLDERYSTGSSLMPQKRNADPLELARGKTGRLIGHLSALLVTLKGLPSSYNKDLQEDKEGLFDTVDTVQTLLPVISAVIYTLRIHDDRMRAALDEELLATDLADYLVERGMPFRNAHHTVGRAVQLAAHLGIQLSQLSPSHLQALSPLFEDNVKEVFDFQRAVDRRRTPGGTAPETVAAQIAAGRRWLESHAEHTL